MKYLFSFLLVFSSAYCLAQDKNAVFEKAKGKLEVPVAKYTKVIKPPGSSQIRGCMSFPGVQIFTDSSTEVRAIFEGRVVLAILSDENRYIVITQHGDYFVTYYDLSNCYIKKNTYLQKGELLGYNTKDDDDRYCLNIEMAKKSEQLNPFHWIKW